ncbi:MAG: sugar transferase [Planctomycetia bacterium]|nr:sugar transferase [Planctomycetia bacterium]
MSTQTETWPTTTTLALPAVLVPSKLRRRESTARPRRSTPRRVVATQNPTEVLAKIHSGRTIVASQGNRSVSYRVARRLLDIVGALVLIVLLSPLMLTALLVLLVTTGGRPLFCQRRVGEGGRLFPMLKFRTMRRNAAQLQHLVKNEHQGPIFKNRRDPRITRFGRLLRRTSIDEMPQLLNVLAGHMSLVGPRPPIAEEVAKYELWQRQRLSVRPGLTCLWQVSGRSDIGFEDWVRMDIWYVRNQNLWTDLVLLFKTPLTVVTCRGAY